MYKKELILTLLNLNKIGRKTINKLINNFVLVSMDSQCILDFILENLQKTKLNITIEDVIIAKNKSLNIIEYCENNNIEIITILDNDFPAKLKIISDNPVIIFYKGNKSCITQNKSVAIIGTRNPTLEGKIITRRLTKFFSENNYIIVSGLAHGIDYNAHISAIRDNNKTLAVLPCGISNIYPSDHKSLCDEILYNDGCIMSEYLPYETPYKNHFIERDRLQSALSLGVIVVECSINSGTMHTVNFAKEQNKLICCFKHKNMKEEFRSGNKKLLENKNTIIIDNNYNLNLLNISLNEKLLETNDLPDKKLLFNKQISFNI